MEGKGVHLMRGDLADGSFAAVTTNREKSA